MEDWSKERGPFSRLSRAMVHRQSANSKGAGATRNVSRLKHSAIDAGQAQWEDGCAAYLRTRKGPPAHACRKMRLSSSSLACSPHPEHFGKHMFSENSMPISITRNHGDPLCACMPSSATCPPVSARTHKRWGKCLQNRLPLNACVASLHTSVCSPARAAFHCRNC